MRKGLSNVYSGTIMLLMVRQRSVFTLTLRTCRHEMHLWRKRLKVVPFRPETRHREQVQLKAQIYHEPAASNYAFGISVVSLTDVYNTEHICNLPTIGVSAMSTEPFSSRNTTRIPRYNITRSSGVKRRWRRRLLHVRPQCCPQHPVRTPPDQAGSYVSSSSPGGGAYAVPNQILFLLCVPATVHCRCYIGTEGTESF
jgi:hypothetical protein